MLKKINCFFNSKQIDFIFLSLLLLTLPSFEAPKNLFLILFVAISSIQFYFLPKKSGANYWDLVFILFILSGFLSTLLAGIQNYSEWKGFAVICTYIFTGWAVSKKDYIKSKVNLMYILIIFSTVLTLIFSFYELYTQKKEYLELNSIGHTNHSAIYLLLVLNLCLSKIFFHISNKSTTKKNETIILTITSFIIFYGLYTTDSRIAIFTSLLSFIFYLFLYPNTKKLKIFILSFFALLFFSLNFTNAKLKVIEKNNFYIANNNFYADRLEIWNSAYAAFKSAPLFGIGNFNWKAIDADNIKKNNYKIFKSLGYNFRYGHAHSLYFGVLAERGIFGFFTLMVFMFYWAHEIYKGWKIYNGFKNVELGAAFGGWLAIFLVGIFNSSLNHENAILALIYLGLLIKRNKFESRY